MSRESTHTTESERWIQLLGWVAVVGCTLQALKAIRFPNLWAATHLNFDYHFGFMKRALLGELLRSFGIDMGSYASVMGFGFAALIAAFLALWLLGRRAGLNQTTSGALLLAVFWTSWAVGYSVHTVAYFDHVLLLLALGSILLCVRLPPGPAVASVCAIGVVGILIHENYAVVHSPLVCVCLLLQRRYIGCAVFFAAMLVTLYGLLQLGDPTGVSKAELAQHYRSIMDYGFRPGAVDVLFRDTAANLAGMQRRWAVRSHWVSLVLSLFAFGCAGLLLIWAAVERVRKQASGTMHSRLLVCAVSAAAFAPLLLHVFAWDMHRWNGMVVVNAYVLLCVVQMHAGEPLEFTGAQRWRYYRWGVFAVLFGLATGFGLFNRLPVVNAPFQPHVDYVLDWLGGDAEFPRVPER